MAIATGTIENVRCISLANAFPSDETKFEKGINPTSNVPIARMTKGSFIDSLFPLNDELSNDE